VTEFALFLPLMLGFLGLTIDFARVFQVWMTLESATRDAAEAAATNATTSAAALSLARRTVCLQARTLPGFTPSASPSPDDINQCVAPNVTVPSFTLNTTAPGATSAYPIGSATVQTSVPFRTLFAYPFITQNGTWTVVTRGSFSVVQGRK
jgi:Flp pilus assembly protein TadG